STTVGIARILCHEREHGRVAYSAPRAPRPRTEVRTERPIDALTQHDRLTEAPRCPRCAGRNEPGASVCGFCASPLMSANARGSSTSASTWRGWMLAGLGLVLVGLLVLAGLLTTHTFR